MELVKTMHDFMKGQCKESKGQGPILKGISVFNWPIVEAEPKKETEGTVRKAWGEAERSCVMKAKWDEFQQENGQ